MVTKCEKITLYKRSPANKTGEIIRVRCGLWSCKHCSEINKRRVIARAINGTIGYKDWYLVTLTVGDQYRGFDPSIKQFRIAWRKLYMQMKKAILKHSLADEFLYLRVYERHKDGTLHIHLLTNVNFQSRSKRIKTDDKRRKKKIYEFVQEYRVKRRDNTIYYRSAWLSDYSVACGLGYICECRPLKGFNGQPSSMGVIAYVAKYLNKPGNTMDLYPKGFHRIEFSQSFPQLPDLSDGETEFVMFTWYAIFNDLIDEFNVTDETNRNLIGLIWLWGVSRFGQDS